jgi:hypothetical protein
MPDSSADFQHPRGALDDLYHRFEVVIIQTIDRAETRAQRRGDERKPGRGSDHSKARQFQADGTSRRSLADDDIQREILHRGIQHFLHCASEAVNFVNEDDIPSAEVGEDGGQVAGALDGGTRRHFDVDSHFIAEHMRERGLAQAGRTVKQDVIQRLAAVLGRIDQNGQVFLDLILPDDIRQFLRTQGIIHAVIGFGFGVEYRDVFLHDTETGITTCISNAPNGDPGNEFSGSPRISSDGNHIVFTSYASNLGPVDNNNRPDIYLYDIQTGIHSLISISSDGIQSNQYSYVGNISGDGRFIAFTSDASNLVSGDTNNKRDVFLHDTQTGTTTRVNVSSSGQQTTWGITQNTPSLSDDGRFVTFDSQAGNLASDGPGSTTYYDIFLRDTLAGTTTLISASSAGVRANSHSNNPVISGNGLFIAFDSGANNLIAGDTNNSRDVFIHEIPISIKIDRAGQNPTNAMEVHFDLLFTRPMVDVDAADFSLTTSGALSGASVTEVSGSGSLYTVTVSTGTGDGTLRLDVPAATAMTDEYGNLPNGLPLNGPEYVIDKTPPAVTSINRSSAETTNSASVNFVITFSESVTNVDALDFGLVTSGSVSGALITNVSGSGNTRTVTVNTGTGDGSLRLDLIDNDSVVDLAGNALGGNGEGNGDFDTGEGYTLIKSMPVTTVRLSEPFQRFRTSNPTPTFLWNNVSVLEWYEIVISTNRSFTNIVLQQTVTSTTFTPASPLADGVYYWRVRHFNSGFSAARYFIIDTTPPAVPTLTSPRNNAVLSATPNFRWTRVAGAALFEFRYDDDSDCASPIYTYSSRSNFRKPPAMPAGTYYWCVRAQDAAGNWSSLSAPGVITISP